MQIYEDMPGIKVGANSVSLDYNITGAVAGGLPLDYPTVKAALLAYAPVSNAPPGSVYAWPRRGLDLKEVGWGIWKATITWAELNYQYAVKIAGQQQQIRSSKQTTHAYPAGAPDQANAIGWDGRSVHGCSIYVPTKHWTETCEIPLAGYTFDYEDKIDNVMMSPVNDASFRGYAAGEVIFLGANISISTQNPDTVTAAFDFAWSPNYSSARSNTLTIGTITGIEKGGWEYLWVVYEPAVQTPVGGSPALAPAAKHVYVERVYDSGDFSKLNIGTALALPLWQG